MFIKIKQYTKENLHRAWLILSYRNQEHEWRKQKIKENLQEEIAAFLCSEEYVRSTGVKRLYYRFIYKILLDTHGTINLPDHEIEALARCFLPDILAFFESEEGKAEFEAWKAEKAKQTKQIDPGKNPVIASPACQ